MPGDAAPEVAALGRRDHAGDRRAVADNGDIDGVLVAPGNEFLGAVERVDQDEAAVERRHLALGDGFLGHHRHARQDLRQPFQDRGLGGLVGGGHRRLVALEPVRDAARRDVENDRGGARDDFRECIQHGGGLGGRDVGGAQLDVLSSLQPLRSLAVGQVRCIRRKCRHDKRFAGTIVKFAPLARESGGPFMSGSSIEALDLAALLCSRVCHDLISPVGAIVNGLEVLAEEKDAETQAFALDLIKKSATTASAKLQFCRIAFGAAGSAGAQIDTGDAEKITRGFLEDDKTKLTWNLARAFMPKNRVKLLLNMLLMAGQAIPRGGQLTIDAVGEGEAVGFKVTATGTIAKIPPTAALLSGEAGEEALDAHRIQPFYAGLLAQACGLKAAAAMEGDAVVITAQ